MKVTGSQSLSTSQALRSVNHRQPLVSTSFYLPLETLNRVPLPAQRIKTVPSIDELLYTKEDNE